MNKIYIAGVALLATVSLVQAQEGTVRIQDGIQANVVTLHQGVKGDDKDDDTVFQRMMTGDEAVDTQIKTLTKEMHEKIQAIHEEYLAKIKAITGDKENLRRAAVKMPEQTTLPDERRGMNEVKKMGRRMMGSTTPFGMRVISEDDKRDSDQDQSAVESSVGETAPQPPVRRRGPSPSEAGSKGDIGADIGSRIQTFLNAFFMGI